MTPATQVLTCGAPVVPQCCEVSTRPSNRQLRIIRNLIAQNPIWETVGRDYFIQFDEVLGKEIRIRPAELQQMEACGWIRLIRRPKSEQRLDHYELTAEGGALEGVALRKLPQHEIEPGALVSRRRRA